MRNHNKVTHAMVRAVSKVDAAALQRMRILDRLGEAIGEAVQALYAQVADAPETGFHFPTGHAAAAQAGYRDEDLAAVPDEVLARFAGVGCPWRAARPQPGARILDLGCGSGTDLFVAADAVGDAGEAVGLDMTPAMVARTRAALERHAVTNARVMQGRMPKFPAELDGPFDLVTSNGALNLVPEKEATLKRIHGLLAPEGRLVLADIALARPPSAACLANAELWAECLVGAFTEDAYLRALEGAGFSDVEVHARRDYFADSPSEATRETARDLGGFAWVVTARRS